MNVHFTDADFENATGFSLCGQYVNGSLTKVATKVTCKNCLRIVASRQKRILVHRTMSDWRAVHDPQRHVIQYEQLRNGIWTLDYTANDTDRATWFYDGCFVAQP